MTDIFPSVWELLLPNLNTATLWGVALIVLGIVFFFIAGSIDAILNRLNAPITVGKLSLLLIFIGVMLVWGVSIAADFLNSLGGTLIFWGSVITLVLAFLMFGKSNKKSGGKLQL